MKLPRLTTIRKGRKKEREKKKKKTKETFPSHFSTLFHTQFFPLPLKERTFDNSGYLFHSPSSSSLTFVPNSIIHHRQRNEVPRTIDQEGLCNFQRQITELHEKPFAIQRHYALPLLSLPSPPFPSFSFIEAPSRGNIYATSLTRSFSSPPFLEELEILARVRRTKLSNECVGRPSFFPANYIFY